MLEGLKNSTLRAFGLVFPRLCPGCERPLSPESEFPVCEPCQERIYPLEAPFCQVCCEKFHGELGDSFTCFTCKNQKPAFDFARTGFHAFDLIRELVHEFKYSRQMQLGPLLATLLGRALEDRRFANGDWVLVPVPLHPARKRERQFNQAEELCRLLCKTRELKMVNALRRIRYTGSQAQLEQHERLTNLKGAFAMSRSKRKRDSVSNANVILVDDILTTGSTAHECAKVLKEFGNSPKVAVITIARAGHPPRG
ncbi:MAG: competence protein ComFC [Verrucomicrobiales bacterium]|jgi:competence protein ComFC